MFSSDGIVATIKEFDNLTNSKDIFSYNHIEMYDLKEGMARIDADTTREKIKEYTENHSLEGVHNG